MQKPNSSSRHIRHFLFWLLSTPPTFLDFNHTNNFALPIHFQAFAQEGSPPEISYLADWQKNTYPAQDNESIGSRMKSSATSPSSTHPSIHASSPPSADPYAPDVAFCPRLPLVCAATTRVAQGQISLPTFLTFYFILEYSRLTTL